MEKTIYDPYAYYGSGSYWVRHLKKHGYDITTEVLGVYETKEQLQAAGLHYSKLWKVVESEQWANLIDETGNGGGGVKGRPLSEAHKQKLRDVNIGKKHSPETKEKIRCWGLGQKHSPETIQKMQNIKLGKPRSEETKRKISMTRLERQIPSGMTGKQHTDAARQKMSITKSPMVRVTAEDSKPTADEIVTRIRHQ